MGNYQLRHREGSKQTGQIFGSAHTAKPNEVPSGKYEHVASWSSDKGSDTKYKEGPYSGEDKKGFRSWKPDTKTFVKTTVLVLIVFAIVLLIVKILLG